MKMTHKMFSSEFSINQFAVGMIAGLAMTSLMILFNATAAKAQTGFGLPSHEFKVVCDLSHGITPAPAFKKIVGPNDKAFLCQNGSTNYQIVLSNVSYAGKKLTLSFPSLVANGIYAFRGYSVGFDVHNTVHTPYFMNAVNDQRAEVVGTVDDVATFKSERGQGYFAITAIKTML